MIEADTRVTALTIREREVTKLLLAGLGIKEIGIRLQISPNTVRNHVKRVYSKLGVHDRIALVLAAVAAGLVRVTISPSPDRILRYGRRSSLQDVAYSRGF